MIGRAYLLEHPSPPGPARRWVDQHALPTVIDTVGAVEWLLEAVAQAARRQPATVLGIAASSGVLAAMLLPRGGRAAAIRAGRKMSDAGSYAAVVRPGDGRAPEIYTRRA